MGIFAQNNKHFILRWDVDLTRMTTSISSEAFEKKPRKLKMNDNTKKTENISKSRNLKRFHD